MTLVEKQKSRYRMVYIAFGVIVLIPLLALILLLLGIDPSSATGLFGVSSATLSAIVIGHFSTSPKDDKKDK